MSLCGNCVHRIEIPGNCHIGCNNYEAAKPTLRRWRGCGAWPINFDEIIVTACSGMSRDSATVVKRKSNPLMDLARLLAR